MLVYAQQKACQIQNSKVEPLKKAPTGEVGYAQGQAGENMLAGSQGIEPDASSDQSRPEEAGYAQGTAGENPSPLQGIGPDVPSNQGEVSDNTNVESVQFQRCTMTWELIAMKYRQMYGWGVLNSTTS